MKLCYMIHIIPLILIIGLTSSEQIASKSANTSTPAPAVSSTPVIKTNGTGCDNSSEDGDASCSKLSDKGVKSYMDKFQENKGMVLRTFYVLLGVTGVIVIYFVVRSVSIRRRNKRVRKYGLLTNSDKYEMQPLDQDDDDEEDVTVYEMNGRMK